MAQAQGDPEQIREFAQILNEYCTTTLEGLHLLRSRLEDMGSSTWNDQVFQKYRELFDEAATPLNATVTQMQAEQPQFLHEAARRLEDYQGV